MKICWDNLEKLVYDLKKECWYDKKHNTFHIHICNNCGEEFLGRSDSKNKSCDLKCWHSSKEHCEMRSTIMKGRKHSKETKKKMSIAHKGKKHSDKTKRKIGIASKKRMTKEMIERIKYAISGDKHYNWKGGKNVAWFDTYAHQISFCEKIRRCPKNKDY